MTRDKILTILNNQHNLQGDLIHEAYYDYLKEINHKDLSDSVLDQFINFVMHIIPFGLQNSFPIVVDYFKTKFHIITLLDKNNNPIMYY